MIPKPAKGTALRAKRKRKAKSKATEREIMNQARARDGGCRYPGCRYLSVPIEVEHERHRGMGGNPNGDRTTQQTVISLCRNHHRQYDDKLFDISTGAHGFDGPARFTRRWTPGFGGGVVGTTEPRCPRYIAGHVRDTC